MKQYVRYFKWYFVLVGLLAAVYGGILLVHGSSDFGERRNGECLTEERVFDYGGVLSEKEERRLRELIQRRERQTGCDIVLVTLNESLKEYARGKEPDVPYGEFVRVFAEDFYDENGFGYDKPVGDGVLLVDNWYREDDGDGYTWLCVVGRPDLKYGLEGMNCLLDNVYRYVERSPYRAYRTYINEFYHDMTGSGRNTAYLAGKDALPFAVALAGMLLFLVFHWSSKKGQKTVTASTYVEGGKPRLYRKEDVLVNTVVTKRRIQTDGGHGGRSGSVGGRSSGTHGHGGHHGGAGRHR